MKKEKNQGIKKGALVDKNNNEKISIPWSKTKDEILSYFGVSKEEGLTESEALERKRKFRENKLRKKEEKSAWLILANQFKSLLILLLVIATIISFLFGKVIEGVSISIVLIISAAIGFFTEIKAIRSMEALQEMTKTSAKVRRKGEVKKINAEELVPGDIVTLGSGDIVPADLRIIEASKLQADESSLTGESVPLGKTIDPLGEETPLAERENMLFKGTHITRGSAEGVTVSTGMDTELGKISESIEEAEEEETPLEKRLDNLAQRLIPLLIIIAIVIAVAGIIRGKALLLMIETSIALAVATVPEGLPIVATLALARGMWRMAEQNALVNRLSSVETLGSTNMICTDKTGTLTENRMTINKYSLERKDIEVDGTGLDIKGDFSQEGETLDLGEEEVLRKSLEVGVLCNNASFDEDQEGEKRVIGDPMEVSLLVAGLKAGIDRDELLKVMPEKREVSFDPSVKMMGTFHESDGNYQVAVKGAPEAVLVSSTHVLSKEGTREISQKDKEEWLRKNESMAEDGLRVLALAVKEVGDSDVDPYENLTFLGLVAMIDPPRKEVKPAIETCQSAGIRIIMVTGDHAATARNVGYSLGLVKGEDVEVVHGSELKDSESLSDEERKRLVEAPIFARVDPSQKLDLIEIHQDAGSIVAMTGDGVNDAPALKKADIGIAMGKRGTQVAQEAADMILQDDNFSTITKAVEQGRIIFENIRKFVVYLLSCNISELLVIFFASLVGVPLPILPLQILFLNVVNDIFPAFALGVGEGRKGIMNHPPRESDEPILTRDHWLGIGSYGLLISIATLLSFGIAGNWFGLTINGEPNYQVITISFLTLAFAQLWHIFNMRRTETGLLKNEITDNIYVWGALVLCSIILLVATYLPGISNVLHIINPTPKGWLLIIVMSLAPFIIGQVYKEISKIR